MYLEKTIRLVTKLVLSSPEEVSWILVLLAAVLLMSSFASSLLQSYWRL